MPPRSQYGGYDAFSLAAFAPGDAFAGVRQTARTYTGGLTGGASSGTVNLLGLGLVLAVLLVLEHLRP